MGITDFSVVVPDVEETYPEGLAPQEIVAHIARLKSDAAAPLVGPEDILITADTMVFLENDRLGKPRDEADALRMLTELAGHCHTALHGRDGAGRAARRKPLRYRRTCTSVLARRRSCAPTSPPASRWTRRRLRRAEPGRAARRAHRRRLLQRHGTAGGEAGAMPEAKHFGVRFF